MQTVRPLRPRLPAPPHAVRSSDPRVTSSVAVEKGVRVRQFLDKVVRWPGIYHFLRYKGVSNFKEFATINGIDWDGNLSAFKAAQNEMDAIYEETANPKVEYPWYYLKPFHAYDTGHLSWDAAYEVESALEALCLRQYGDLKGRPKEAKERLMTNIRQAWKERLPKASKALDMGCGVGISTEQVARAYSDADVTGIDLSPYCLAVAKYNEHQREGSTESIQFLHMNAEDASQNFPNGSFDFVSLTFIIHECPKEVNEKLTAEAFKLCRPGGMFTITESDNRSDPYVNTSVWFKSLQHMTEPFMVEYASTDVEKMISDAGFVNVTGKSVSPKYCTWTAFKPESSNAANT